MDTHRLQSPIISVSFEKFAVFICSLPLVSFAACVVLSLVWHFDETTRTHCKVSCKVTVKSMRMFIFYECLLTIDDAIVFQPIRREVLPIFVNFKRNGFETSTRGFGFLSFSSVLIGNLAHSSD